MQKVVKRSSLIHLKSEKEANSCKKGCKFMPIGRVLTEKEQKVIGHKYFLKSKWECVDCKGIILKVKDK